VPSPHILVVHGALGSAEQMRPIAEALGELAPTRLVELPGHGDTALGVHEFSIRGFGGVLAAAAGASRPLVFGYSMGGYAALALEAERPGTFAGIVTLGTKFAWTPEAAAREVARLDASVIAAKVPRFAAMLEARHSRSGGWELNLSRTAALLTAIGRAPILDDATLARLSLPVLFGVGERDDTVGADETARVAAAVTNGRSTVLTGAGHAIESVSVDAIVTLVRSPLDAAGA
jgi:pimeloyl-ACP methyl ester carboxylesterase